MATGSINPKLPCARAAHLRELAMEFAELSARAADTNFGEELASQSLAYWQLARDLEAARFDAGDQVRDREMVAAWLASNDGTLQ